MASLIKTNVIKMGIIVGVKHAKTNNNWNILDQKKGELHSKGQSTGKLDRNMQNVYQIQNALELGREAQNL